MPLFMALALKATPIILVWLCQSAQCHVLEERTTRDGLERGIAELERDPGFKISPRSVKPGQHISKYEGLGVREVIVK